MQLCFLSISLLAPHTYKSGSFLSLIYPSDSTPPNRLRPSPHDAFETQPVHCPGKTPTQTRMPTHLEGAGSQVLMDKEDDQPLEVEEDGAAGKAVSAEGSSPRTTRAWGQLPHHARGRRVIAIAITITHHPRGC